MFRVNNLLPCAIVTLRPSHPITTTKDVEEGGIANISVVKIYTVLGRPGHYLLFYTPFFYDGEIPIHVWHS
jgi:hypothetical protein